MSVNSISGGQRSVPEMAQQAPTKKNDPKDIKGAAQQFESLLVAQLLKSACSAATFTGAMGDGDSGGSTAIEMAQEQLASSLTASGGLGLARMITDSLNRQAASEAAPPIKTAATS